MKVGAACGSLQAPPPKVATLTGSWGRDGPRRIEGDARRKQHAHEQSRRFRYSEAAPRRIDPASNAGPLRRLGRFRVRTEATDNVAWPLLKNRALTSSVNTWAPLAGWLLTGRRRRPTLTYTAVNDGDDLSDRFGDGPCCSCPASCDARAVLRAHPRALLPPETP
jgi:hypothetical protein